MSFDIPEGHFVHTTDTAQFIVRSSDGEAVSAIEDGEPIPIDKWKSARVKGGLSVGNPDGFVSHPEHDRTDPAHQLATYGLSHRDHFIHWDAAHPTVVRRADGEAVFRLKEGRCEAV